MRTAAVVGCCTAKLLYGFPDDYSVRLGIKLPKELEVTKKCQKLKDDGFAIVTAYLTNEQKKAQNLLKAVGFNCSPAATKSRHPETQLYVLTLHLDKLKGTK